MRNSFFFILFSLILAYSFFLLLSRLTGYELALFGFPSRMYPLVRRAVKDDMDALEVILFGEHCFVLSVCHERSRYVFVYRCMWCRETRFCARLL